MRDIQRDINDLQKAKVKAQRSQNLKEEATLCNQLGELLAKDGQFSEAADEHRQELQLSELVNDVIGAAVANRRIGECLAEMGSYQAALKHQRVHLSLARSVANVIEEQRAWATIGRTYLYMHEANQRGESLRGAEEAFRQSLLIVDEKLGGKVSDRELSEMRARLYLNLGFLYDSIKDSVKCSQYIRKSVFIAEKNNLYEDLYRAKLQLGNIHIRSGQHSQAIRCLQVAKECAQKTKEKFLESECFGTIGQVLLSLGDFVAGKRSLKQAYRLGSQEASEHKSVRRLLRYAIKGCQAEEALVNLPEGEHLARMGLSEELGDLCCKVGAYRKAVDCYTMQLSEAEVVGRPERELAVIHVSLATTFTDLKDYRQSVSHYQAELRFRKGNPKEECETWLNIALAKEEDGQAFEELEPCYQRALESAQQAPNPHLQVRVLHLLLLAQQKRGLPQAEGTQARLQQLAQHQAGSEEEEEENSETLEDSEPLEESELELSSDEEDLEGYSKLNPGRRRTKQWNRRNEKGETVLHRACIEGNLRHAQNLVAKGHPLNPRDYCGWTPLHEACNHGHLEIVRLLLDSGVNKNDAGGSHCDGITPLHDAITCGKFQVAELLIQRGASVTALNAKGKSPLDSLSDWYQMYGKHLDKDTKQQCCQTQRLLKAALAKGPQQASQASQGSDLFDSECSQLSVSLQETRDVTARNRGFPPASQRETGQLARHTGGRLTSGTQASSTNRPDWGSEGDVGSSDEDVDDEDLMVLLRPVKRRPRVMGSLAGQVAEGDRLSPPLGLCDDRDFPEEPDTDWDWDSSRGRSQVRDLEAPNAGTAVYLQAMRGLGSAKSRLLEPGLSIPDPPIPLDFERPALVPEEQDLADDWLEDDLREARPRKRARGEQHWGTGDSEQAAPGSGEESLVRTLTQAPTTHISSSSTTSSRLGLKNKRRSRQMRMTQIVDRTVLGRSKGSGEQRAGASVPTVPESSRETLTTTLNQTLSVTQPVLAAVAPVIRVRVRVQDKLFLIPVPHSDSETRDISWLAEQASQRYYRECGLRPRLRLKKEGALLASDDPVLHVLQSNEEVLAEVMSWDLPPLSDRYKRACQSLSTAENRLVLRIMEMQENNTCFSLANLSLGPDRLPPVLRALKQQSSTRELCLSGDRLCDRLLGELADTLNTLPSLTRLDLANNHITAQGLRALCDPVLRPPHLSFQSLEELDLSLNPLGDACAPSIAHLLTSCPALSTLRLQACQLTARLFHQQRPLLSEAITQAVHLHTLVLSHNQLDSGVETVLRSLPHQSLIRLELNCVSSSPRDPRFLEPVIRYLGQEGCALTHLNLAGNRLTDDCIGDLARCLLLCGSLVSLDLSANPGITRWGLERLLLAIGGRSVGMQYLSLAGCSVTGSLDGLSGREGLRELRLCGGGLGKRHTQPPGHATVHRQHKRFTLTANE